MDLTFRPRIAIPVPTSTDQAYNDRSWPNYADAVREAGGEPVRLGLTASVVEVRAVIAGCAGVCLPGSPADVEPGRFGQERDPSTAPGDGPREAMDFLLLEDAERAGKPVLGICYGLQSLNVWRGGTLVQDVSPVPVNHSAGRAVAVAHAVLLDPGSVLAGLTDAAEAPVQDAGAERGTGAYLRLPVNTSHHQAVGRAGDGLRVVARCPDDGVVEAVENGAERRGQWLVGVQWHPERSTAISPTSRNLFRALVEEARAVGARQAEPAVEDVRA